MKKKFVTRQFEIEDLDGIIQLLRLSFPEWNSREKPLDYWRWKYNDTPHCSSIVVASDGNRIIGVGHDINLKIKLGNAVLRAQYGDDFATHPDYRGMGVYNQIVNRINETQGKNVQFDFWLSTNPIVIDASKKRTQTTRFRFPYSLTHLFRVKDLSSHIDNKGIKNQTMAKGGIGVVKTMNKLKNMIHRKPETSNNITVKDSIKFSVMYDIFWESIRNRFNFIIEKDSSYLNWRFNDPRGGSYKIKEALIGGSIAGYAVLQTRINNGYSEGYIVDLLAYSDKVEVYNALLNEACNYFDDLGLNAVHIQLVEGSPMKSILQKFDFFEPPGTTRAYIGCNLNDGFENDRKLLESSTPEQLHFNYGDYY